MIYIATPYSTEDTNLRNERYDHALDITAFFMKKGLYVFSPIVHCHTLATVYDLSLGYSWWRDYDEHMINLSTQVWFALMPGYSKSVGMKGEYEKAVELNKDRRIILPNFEYSWGEGHYHTSEVVTGDFLGDHEG